MNAADELLRPALSAHTAADPAIIAGEITLSYAELNRAACRAGEAMQALGVGAGDRVLILQDDSAAFCFSYLGAMKLGAVPVALSLRLAVGDLRFIGRDSEAVLLVADSDYLALCEQASNGETRFPKIVLAGAGSARHPGLADLMAACRGTLQSVSRRPDETALWMYSSGTTGQPKAVVHIQKSIGQASRYLQEVFGVGPGDRLFCSSKLFFAFSIGHCFLGALRCGACAILHSGWPSAEEIASVVKRHRPTVFFSVPTFYRNLLGSGLADARTFASVQLFVSAGERLPEALCRRWHDATGSFITEGVGATETLVMFLGNRPQRPCPGRSGTPYPGCELRLCDDTGQEIAEADRPGVLWVRSETLAVAYWQQPAKTAAAFVNGWYCTGDIFSRDPEGHYRHQGRADDMLKISGQWVSPAEIEAKVTAHAAVGEAVVVGSENEDGLIRLTLCLVLAQPCDRSVLETQLIESLTAAMSIYKCPRRFLYLDEIPRTASGKVQRFKLRRMAAELSRA